MSIVHLLGAGLLVGATLIALAWVSWRVYRVPQRAHYFVRAISGYIAVVFLSALLTGFTSVLFNVIIPLRWGPLATYLTDYIGFFALLIIPIVGLLTPIPFITHRKFNVPGDMHFCPLLVPIVFALLLVGYVLGAVFNFEVRPPPIF